MKLPLHFQNKHDFSVSIDSLNQHMVKGRFCINDARGEINYEFSGLAYPLNHDTYNFTFSLNWDNDASYTTFSAMLKLSSESTNNRLDLNWLKVDKENKLTIQGSTHLCDLNADTVDIKMDDDVPYPVTATAEVYV